MKPNRLFIYFSFIFFTPVFSQAQNYSVASIPAELLNDAFAVVRESSEEFVQQDLHNGTHKVSYAVTVLNGKGDANANFYLYEDSFRELKNFSGELFNAAGKSIRKISKKDLTVTAISSNLATDGKHTFYNLYAPAYPFTVKYTYEVKYKKGILMFPTFVPVSNFYVSLEKASYFLQIPPDLELREKKLNTEVERQEAQVAQNKTYRWSVRDFKALPHEPHIADSELFPVVYLSPEKFCVENVCGNMANWETFGRWQAGLLEGRNQLPQKTIDKILELTQNKSETRDKVKALYEYLQQTTHYVSIQLGIGGWQPMKAEEVARTGFGDCKALSNYMKAMLDVLGIPSYYTVISTKKKRFFSDYPNFSQANHVILMVPLEKDSVWLECTSQALPFGYIHKDILGHDALAVGDKTVFFHTLPEYRPSDNQEINAIDVRLTQEGHSVVDVHSTYKMGVFEHMFFKLKGLNAKEENEAVGGLLRVPKPQVSNFRKEASLSESPVLDIYYTVNCEEYASQTASRMFILLNPVYTSLKGFLSGNSRRYNLDIHSSICKMDTIRLYIPGNYALESKLEPVEIRSDYGFFKTEVEERDKTITYIQRLELTAGRYPALEFEKIKKFYDTVERLQTAKIGLKKETD